jgi:hypothetical protein
MQYLILYYLNMDSYKNKSKPKADILKATHEEFICDESTNVSTTQQKSQSTCINELAHKKICKLVTTPEQEAIITKLLAYHVYKDTWKEMFFKFIHTGVKLTDEKVRELFRDFISEVRPDLMSCDFEYTKVELLKDKEFKFQIEMLVPYFQTRMFCY